MEPTGHYWFNLAQHLKTNGLKIVLVNTFAVKRSKELDDNNPTKNDRKDSKTIAMLVKDGRYMEPYIPQGVYAELRTAMNSRWQINKSLNRIKNQGDRWLRIYFPEFLQVFADREEIAALIILLELKTPEKILEQTVDEMVGRWRQNKIRAVGKNRAEALFFHFRFSSFAAVKTGNSRSGVLQKILYEEVQTCNFGFTQIVIFIQVIKSKERERQRRRK